jgi:hypothetical protein
MFDRIYRNLPFAWCFGLFTALYSVVAIIVAVVRHSQTTDLLTDFQGGFITGLSLLGTLVPVWTIPFANKSFKIIHCTLILRLVPPVLLIVYILASRLMHIKEAEFFVAIVTGACSFADFIFSLHVCSFYFN